MFTYGREPADQAKPLLGLNYCRRLTRLATGRTAAYHVGSRRRNFLVCAVLT